MLVGGGNPACPDERAFNFLKVSPPGFLNLSMQMSSSSHVALSHRICALRPASMCVALRGVVPPLASRLGVFLAVRFTFAAIFPPVMSLVGSGWRCRKPADFFWRNPCFAMC
jgi:hypothetical protein